MGVKSYSPGQVIVKVGPFTIKSWTEIEIDYADDKWKFEQGIYGELARIKSNSVLGTITMTMPQTSQGNTINTLAYAFISDTIDIAGVVPVFVYDNWNKPLHVMLRASIIKMPKATYNRRVSSRQWAFKGGLDVNSLIVEQSNLSIADAKFI